MKYLHLYIYCLYLEFISQQLDTAGSGQREPPRLVLEVGETSTLQAAKSPPLQSSKWGGDFSFPGMAAIKVGVHAGLTQLYD